MQEGMLVCTWLRRRRGNDIFGDASSGDLDALEGPLGRAGDSLGPPLQLERTRPDR